MASINNPSVYVRFFDKNEMEQKQQTKYTVSFYFPDIMKENLRDMMFDSYIDTSEYILCPLYKSGDFQIGITGTVKRREDNIQAITREMGEELGIFPEGFWKIDQRIITRNNKQFKFSVYRANIAETKNLSRSKDGKIVSNNPDTMDKVGCFIHGTESEIINYLDSPNIYRYYSEDEIVGVCAIKVADIKI